MNVQEKYKNMLIKMIEETMSIKIQSSEQLIQEIIDELPANNLLNFRTTELGSIS